MPIKTSLIFLSIFLSELLSFLGYYFQIINSVAFFAIAILTIILSIYKLEYGLWILLAELFIGSFGYLFYFEHDGLIISIRQALWLIILSVWLAKTLLSWIKNKKLSVDFFKSSYFNYFFVLFIFIAWGLINGFINKNLSAYIIQDFDRWLFFLLIFPIFSILQNEKNISMLKKVFIASIAWLSLKTIILFYIFSHDFNGFILDVYSWVRLSGAGEITQVQGGFYRIFMQSQIFILIGILILLFYLLKSANGKNKIFTTQILNPVLFLTAILISFSRSFWIGLAVGGIFVWLMAILKLKIKYKQFAVFNFKILLAASLSLILTLAILFFPLPAPLGGFNAADLLGDRATEIAGEAGASSRWQLLKPLSQKINQAPVIGLGYGSTVTYISSDPRVLSQNPTGEFTTYAFEWGWLDVWLKLGFFGLLAYLFLFAKIIIDGIKINHEFSLALAAGLIALIAVNMFSPYINHPLGIGFLIIASAIMEYYKKAPAPLREF